VTDENNDGGNPPDKEVFGAEHQKRAGKTPRGLFGFGKRGKGNPPDGDVPDVAYQKPEDPSQRDFLGINPDWKMSPAKLGAPNIIDSDWRMSEEVVPDQEYHDQSLQNRREFLGRVTEGAAKIAVASTVAGAMLKGAATLQEIDEAMHPTLLPKPKHFTSPPDKEHLDAYIVLENRIPAAIYELMGSPVKMDMVDYAKPLIFDITVIPPKPDIPASGHFPGTPGPPGAIEYTIRRTPQEIKEHVPERSHKLPKVNLMLKALADITVLDEKTNTDKPLNYNEVAKQIEFAIQNFLRNREMDHKVEEENKKKKNQEELPIDAVAMTGKEKKKGKEKSLAERNITQVTQVTQVVEYKATHQASQEVQYNEAHKPEHEPKHEEKKDEEGRLPYPLPLLLADMPVILKGVVKLVAPYCRDTPKSRDTAKFREHTFTIYPTDVLLSKEPNKLFPLLDTFGNLAKNQLKKEFHIKVLNPYWNPNQEIANKINSRYGNEHDSRLISPM